MDDTALAALAHEPPVPVPAEDLRARFAAAAIVFEEHVWHAINEQEGDSERAAMAQEIATLLDRITGTVKAVARHEK